MTPSIRNYENNPLLMTDKKKNCPPLVDQPFQSQKYSKIQILTMPQIPPLMIEKVGIGFANLYREGQV